MQNLLTISPVQSHLSHAMIKPTKWVCAQWRLRSARVSAQSDQSVLCTQWVAKDTSFLHADSEDSDRTGLMPRLMWVFAGCTLPLLVLLYRGSFIFCLPVCALLNFLCMSAKFANGIWDLLNAGNSKGWCCIENILLQRWHCWHSSLYSQSAVCCDRALSFYFHLMQFNSPNGWSFQRICQWWIGQTIWAASWQNQQNGMCSQRRHRSAWAFVQSDQSLRCPHEETLGL